MESVEGAYTFNGLSKRKKEGFLEDVRQRLEGDVIVHWEWNEPVYNMFDVCPACLGTGYNNKRGV